MGTLDRGHLPALLNTASLAYQNAEYRINQVLPMVHVAKKSDEILISDVANAFTLSELARGTDGRSNRTRTKYGTAPYKCLDYATHDYVSDADIKNADMPAFDMYQETTLTLTNKILLGREKRGMQFLSNATIYGDFVDDIEGAWADLDTGNPMADIKAAQAQMLIPGNVLVVGGNDEYLLAQNAKLLARVTGGGTADDPGIIREAKDIARILGLDAVVVIGAKERVNPDEPDADAVWQPIWDNFACLLYIQDINTEAMKLRLRMATFAFMANYDPDGQNRPVQIITDYNKEIDGGSQYIEAQCSDAFAVGLPEAGFLFTNIRE